MPTSTGITAANAEWTDQVWLCLIEIQHPNLSTPYRIVNNTEDVISNGNTYLKAAFNLTLPDDVDEAPSVNIEIDNVDRLIVDLARSVSSPATVYLTVVLADTPNIAEAGPFEMRLVRVGYDRFKVSGTLIYEDVLNEQFPARTFNPARYPGLF
jgi:hypothetical protein